MALSVMALASLTAATACADSTSPGRATTTGTLSSTSTTAAQTSLADVVGVSTTGSAGAYTFSVTVQSPDLGCDQYAQSWEVIDSAGTTLYYRRILMHSHVDEQPFTRSGGPVALQADDQVIVRATMSPGGLGGQAMSGSVADGFSVTQLAPNFGAALTQEGPQAEACAF